MIANATLSETILGACPPELRAEFCRLVDSDLARTLEEDSDLGVLFAALELYHEPDGARDRNARWSDAALIAAGVAWRVGQDDGASPTNRQALDAALDIAGMAMGPSTSHDTEWFGDGRLL